MTLEEAQEQILTLTEERDSLTVERDSLLQENETLNTTVENLRTLNQKYFNKLIAQEENQGANTNEEQDTDIPTCEEFAMNITL